MRDIVRGLLAFSIGSAGMALAFWGALQEEHGRVLLAVAGVLPGLTLLALSFRVAPRDV